MLKKQGPNWKIKSWHYCRHYTGMVKRIYCGASVPFVYVGARRPLPTGGSETMYPCCLEWDGPDNCDRREIEHKIERDTYPREEAY